MLIMNQFGLMAGLKLNELQSRRDLDGVNATFLRSTRLLLLAMTTLAAVLILNAELVVALLFRRGAFDSAAAAQSTVLLRLLALLLPLFSINTLVARLFMSAQKTRQAFWFQVSMGLLHLALTVLGIRALGVAGYPIATCVMYMCALSLLLPLMRRVFPSCLSHRDAFGPCYLGDHRAAGWNHVAGRTAQRAGVAFGSNAGAVRHLWSGGARLESAFSLEHRRNRLGSIDP